MKHIAAIFIIFLVLTGCTASDSEIDRVLQFRTNLLETSACCFDAVITADYGDKTYTFSLACQADKDGNLSFLVKEPEYIADIQGQITYEGGKLTFDEVALAFELQTDDMLSPVSAPWIMLRALRGGYIRSCGREDQMLRVTVDDSYQEDALMLDIWLSENNVPLRADIYEENRRILTVDIKNFEIM